MKWRALGVILRIGRCIEGDKSERTEIIQFRTLNRSNRISLKVGCRFCVDWNMNDPPVWLYILKFQERANTSFFNAVFFNWDGIFTSRIYHSSFPLILYSNTIPRVGILRIPPCAKNSEAPPAGLSWLEEFVQNHSVGPTVLVDFLPLHNCEVWPNITFDH